MGVQWSARSGRDSTTSAMFGVRVVCLSDTHNRHADIDVPDGDILIHAGDFTNHGNVEDVISFNEWLGTLPHKVKIVVNGNHESNASWKKDIHELISNAKVLIDSSLAIDTPSGSSLIVYGTNFTWPMKEGRNPLYDQIPANAAVIVSHGPAAGYVDGRLGCPTFTNRCEELKHRSDSELKLVVSGHIHGAYGLERGSFMAGLKEVKFVNAAIAGGDIRGQQRIPIVVDI